MWQTKWLAGLACVVWGQVSTSTTPTLKAMPRQHSIDLRNNIYIIVFLIIFFLLYREMRLMCMESAQTGRAHTIGPEMGPKRGLGGSTGIYIPFLWEKQWLKAKDVNPPPIRKKNNQKKQRKQKGKKIKRMRGTKWKDVNPMT